MKTNIRVLMIDDNEKIIREVEQHFKGHAVISLVKVATDGLKGLELIKKHQSEYDLILMDLLLSEKDGIENLILA